MPEMTFTVQWPDGEVQHCYSPSLVVHDHLSEGTTYAVGDLLERATLALEAAAERVRERYGFTCTSALATLAQLRTAGSRHRPDALVRVLALDPPLPEPATVRTSA